MQDTIVEIPPLKLNAPEHSFQHLEMSKSYHELAALAANLQEIVLKQQILINTLVLKHQEAEQKLTATTATSQTTSSEVKVEYEPNTKADQTNLSTDNTSEASEVTTDEKEPNATQKESSVIRRNGFKPVKTSTTEKKEELDSDTGSLSDSKKLANSRKNPSKAKHLWVNYGRRIIEYGINQTKGDMQEKIKQLIGKLNSKKDFENVFQIVGSDSADDKLFKTLLGRLAIYFVKHKAVVSFEGSKYKDEMVTQRHVVAAWIERLICE